MLCILHSCKPKLPFKSFLSSSRVWEAIRGETGARTSDPAFSSIIWSLRPDLDRKSEDLLPSWELLDTPCAPWNTFKRWARVKDELAWRFRLIIHAAPIGFTSPWLGAPACCVASKVGYQDGVMRWWDSVRQVFYSSSYKPLGPLKLLLASGSNSSLPWFRFAIWCQIKMLEIT